MRFPAPRSSVPYLVAALLLIPLVLGGLGIAVLTSRPSLRYELAEDRLVVGARLGPFDQGRVIPRAEIADPSAVRIASGRRVIGTAVPGYCLGRYRYPDHGTVWQATSCAGEGVLFGTRDGPVLLTPADRAGFLRALADGSTGRFPPLAGRPPGSDLVLLAAVLGVILAPLPWIGWRMVRPLVYRIEGDTLVVPGFFRPVRVKLAGARVRREPLRRPWRVVGATMPGLYLGWFREGGERLEVAATTLTDGIRVEGDRHVYVSPVDTEGFLAALTAAGAS